MKDVVHDLWCELVREGLGTPDEVQVQAIAGGLGATVEWWLTRAPHLGPAEVDERFRAAFEPGLGAAGTTSPGPPGSRVGERPDPQSKAG